ncbi:SNW domain-containing protein 1 [Monocercomonoides exilis]|uniref:SNW domain-containing protein 1 n=1 Tax=Monocercomonoides exilis TaxID=2049356 RepID=UPI00355A41EA|nr:SNW domain-containing protein 1 [Monocercomonoides exilis]|eukprot:MONOS_5339.1-p1 / transcript=MONOS_5339.1 / gene=MONOS_5339 / organism=Monocercomonoides_exilis_PA203 / gene_product=SNW domain-containing protein 1 / transcript_product=SNW domain-containing protein 1 / location=Mono_scaffold00154:28117-29418(-) / protein_length=386 / sequence_SO=supercontig / SO=protein_coding / is_pseudo=false
MDSITRFIDSEFPLPPEEDVQQQLEETRKAIEKLVRIKTQTAQPSSPVDQGDEVKFIRYTSSEQTLRFADLPNNRLIRLSSMPVDPLEPPKFKVRNTAREPPPPSAPVMHSPPRKLSAEEQKEWDIPACISNWKNPKGYTIPLDLRESADGRTLLEVSLHNSHAQLADSLYIAEREGREEIEKLAAIEGRQVAAQQAEREAQLRQLAAQSRREKAAQLSKDSNNGENTKDGIKRDSWSVLKGSNEEEIPMIATKRKREADEIDETAEKEKDERDRIRLAQKREREREYRRGAHLKEEGEERLILGPHGSSSSVRSSEQLYDPRLFNQSEGLDSGFGDDSEYNVFDQPLFKGTGAAIDRLYHPSSAVGGDGLKKIKQVEFEKDGEA